jgi:hypothetical protein
VPGLRQIPKQALRKNCIYSKTTWIF